MNPSTATAARLTAIQSPRQTVPATDPDQSTQAAASVVALRSHRPKAAETDKAPRWIWRVVQWKYTVDATSDWLKRAYFHYVFLKFNEFSYWLFDLLPPNGRDVTGRLCWTEDQGYYETEWEGEQEAMKYLYGHAIRVPLNASLSAGTVNTEQLHPGSPVEVRDMYKKKAVDPTIPVQRIDLIRLAAQTARADEIIQGAKISVS